MRVIFFFKQKTAYEIKECDWSSDVCSSDLRGVYEEYIIRKSIEEYEDDIEDQTKELITDLKAFLRIPVG